MSRKLLPSAKRTHIGYVAVVFEAYETCFHTVFASLPTNMAVVGAIALFERLEGHRSCLLYFC